MASKPDRVGGIAGQDALNIVLVDLVLKALGAENRAEHGPALLTRLEVDLAALAVGKHDLDGVPVSLNAGAFLLLARLGGGFVSRREFFRSIGSSSSLDEIRAMMLDNENIGINLG